MFRLGFLHLGLSALIFASFSSSTSYKLNSYGVSSGGISNSSSSTYKLQGSAGEQANGTATSTTDTNNSGSVQTEQLNVPTAPTLSNGGGTYYNKLGFTINTGILPGDTTYALAVSTNSFVTTNYVQADGTLNTSPVYQLNSTWVSGGSLIIGLTPSTTYQVKVAAKEGLFTNTEYGAVASAATVANASIVFSVSPNSASLGSFETSTIVTSSNLSFTFATTATYGGSIYVDGTNAGFKSASNSYTIPAYSGDLVGTSQGFGIQATNPTQSSGGPLATVSPFNGTVHSVGAESTTFQPIFTSTTSIVGGTANANVQVKTLPSAPAASDYNEIFTFIASASF